MAVKFKRRGLPEAEIRCGTNLLNCAFFVVMYVSRRFTVTLYSVVHVESIIMIRIGQRESFPRSKVIVRGEVSIHVRELVEDVG